MLYGNAFSFRTAVARMASSVQMEEGQQNDVIAFAQHAGTVELHRLICRE